MSEKKLFVYWRLTVQWNEKLTQTDKFQNVMEYFQGIKRKYSSI